ncbi:MAG TPA: DUF2946 family protein [Stellaceae bacterium]|jgi:hypothetical protein|nr:DUF2946 family protein [Stellaceae bacterium]
MQKRRRGIAWLAVLALLINALVPTSLAAAAAGQGPATVSGWCGTGPGGHPPDRGSAPPICNHCILCTAASAFAPPVATGIRAPARLATAAPGGITPDSAAFPHAYVAAQPRGPPAVSQI